MIAFGMLVGCGGEIASGVDLPDGSHTPAGDASTDRISHNWCASYPVAACPKGCQPMEAPTCAPDVAPVPDGGLTITSPGCVPAVSCAFDAGCPDGSTCALVRYSRCPRGVACTMDMAPLCSQALLCTYPDFP